MEIKRASIHGHSWGLNRIGIVHLFSVGKSIVCGIAWLMNFS